MDQPQHAIEELTRDVARLRIGFVNVYFVGLPRASADATPWALVDAGLAMGAAQILEVAAARFGENSRPAAIILTHGHFDHVGALQPLLAMWDVPVYAHTLELPFLTGRADYPPPDPTVGGGMMARLSPLFPERGIDLGERVKPLPSGSIPGMPGWNWVHTPGHSPGHVSLFRQVDRLMIAGDAVTTTKQESVWSVMTQKQELSGPPSYFTIDWERARRSVATIASLKPLIVATGHGQPMRGDSVPAALADLARDFDRRAKPKRGRYVTTPAETDETGVIALPPPPRSGGVQWGMLSGVAVAAFAGTWLYRRFGRRTSE